MKDKIQSAGIILPCKDLNYTLEFFTGQLGFRLEMIYPADAPHTAVISGYGLVLQLEETGESLPLILNLTGNFTAEDLREIISPDGISIRLINKQTGVEIPEGRQEFVVSTLESENSWSEGRAGMQYRDLIPSRLGGRFIASHIRIPTGGPVADYVHYHKIRFQMIFCLSGWSRLVYENQGEPFLMKAGDCVLQPPEIRHRVLECSDNFEVLEIGCPAVHETFVEHELELPNTAVAPEKPFGDQRFVHHRAEKAVWKKSKTKGFEERDTGIFEATNGLADVHVLRAAADTKLSVRSSGEFLFFFVLKGALQLSTETGATHHLNTNSSVVLPTGAEYHIDAPQGLEMVRICFPNAA